MPGNHSEISVAEQNSVDNNNNNTTRRRKKKKKQKKDHDHEHDDDDDDVRISDEANRIVTPSIRKRFIAKVRKKPKSAKPSSSSGSRKGGCFSVISKRRTEDDDDDDPLSDPNDESFTHEMLRVMLETNDFFCDDCNPHI
ncbi:unnamed protein product [Cochlearia groenlandica]